MNMVMKKEVQQIRVSKTLLAKKHLAFLPGVSLYTLLPQLEQLVRVGYG